MKTPNEVVLEVATEMMYTSMQKVTAETICNWATRLCEAMRRSAETCEKSSQVSNAESMRSELYKLASWIRQLTSSTAARERGIVCSEVRNIAARIETIAENRGVK